MTAPKTFNLGIVLGVPDSPAPNSAPGWPPGIDLAVMALDAALGGTDEPSITANAANIATNTAAVAAIHGLAVKSSDTGGLAVISQKEGTVVLTKSTAGAWTLAAPVAGTDDGKQLLIIAGTAHAHTVTNASPGFNSGGGASDVATFAAVGDSLRIVAYNGAWLTDPAANSASLG